MPKIQIQTRNQRRQEEQKAKRTMGQMYRDVELKLRVRAGLTKREVKKLQVRLGVRPNVSHCRIGSLLLGL